MSLFVGNLSRYVSLEELKKEFEAKGPCKIQLKVSASSLDLSPPIAPSFYHEHQPPFGQNKFRPFILRAILA